MRRLSLSTKLFAAALPLVLAVGALLALTVRSDLNEVAAAERGAELGDVWTPLVAGLTSIEAELASSPAAASGTADQGLIVEQRRATDTALTGLGDAISDLGAAEAARKHITQGRSSLSSARRSIDVASIAPDMAEDPIVAYDVALRELVSIGQLLPAEAGQSQLGQELLAVVKLAEARVAADAVAANVATWQLDPANPTPLATAQVRFTEIESAMNEFSAIAPEEWSKQYRQGGFATSLSQYRAQLDAARRAAEAGTVAEFDLAGFNALSDDSLDLQQDITASIVERATAQAEEVRKQAFIRTIIALAAVLLAALTAWILTRSVTRRVRAISRSANQVATQQMPALVEALRDPRGKAVLPDIAPLSTRGGDELAELAHSFNSMQATLVDVAHEQVEVLRRGVSDIFVTMARRNRSLIDRQLAMLDEFEAEVDDPEVLANYYQLDHMATRMRRNSESLLVLANAEPKRRRVKATEIDDVVRAAIGEVEDYRRIDVESLEHLQVRGNVVADVSHLLAELLDNATSFSPPDSVVRVGGRRAGDSYMLRIVDSGVGISVDRLSELNELLREPPVAGLSVEPTLGMSVVSLLASRHGVKVTLSQGNPGTTVDVLLPSSMFGPIDVPAPDMPGTAPRITAPSVGVTTSSTYDYETFQQAESMMSDQFADTPSSEPTVEPVVEPVVEPAWAGQSYDLSEFKETGSEFGLIDPTPASLSPVALEFRSAPLLPDEALEEALEEQADETVTIQEEPEVVAPAPMLAPISLGFETDRETDRNEFESSFDSATSPQLAVSETIRNEAETVTPVAAEPLLPTRSSAPASEPTVDAAASGEFDRPLSPPVTPESLTRHPVVAGDALPANTVRLAEPVNEANLPTRSPSRGPDGGFDRMAPPTGPAVSPEIPVIASSSPSALQAALQAFDTNRHNGNALPTRPPREGGVPASFDEPPSITQSRLDPDVLRERLRAFQTEFRSGGNNGNGADNDTAADTTSTPNADLGGDPR